MLAFLSQQFQKKESPWGAERSLTKPRRLNPAENPNVNRQASETGLTAGEYEKDLQQLLWELMLVMTGRSSLGNDRDEAVEQLDWYSY